ncbi:MAG: hypothetical protein GC165_01720 [Armatimonadetes bacterium]|nr:hypothetical protein [Armatimonadota bacterium]
MIGSILALMVGGTVPTVTVRIEGDGFFRFAKDNQMFYGRVAQLSATPQGLMAKDGSLLVPRLVAPEGTTKLEVSMDGNITAVLANGSKHLGRFVIAIFETPPKFNHVGNYVTTDSRPTLTSPGEWIAGVIRTNGTATTAPIDTKTTEGSTTTTTPKTAGNNSASEKFVPGTTEIKVNLHSEITSEHILLGDIATIEGDPEVKEKLSVVDFGRAPIYGAKRGLTVLHVRANILAAKIDTRNIKIICPEGATVERKSQKVEPTAISDAVAKAIKVKFGFETQLQEKNRLTTLSVPDGEVTISVSQLNLNNTEISGMVDVLVDGKSAGTVRIGYDLPALSMVKRGDVVRLRLISNFATVEVNAKATTNGYLGQSITVETDNGTTHTGTLIGSGIVEVKL